MTGQHDSHDSVRPRNHSVLCCPAISHVAVSLIHHVARGLAYGPTSS